MEPTGFGPDFWELTRKPRLLVVEDDNDIGNLLKLCFTHQGMDVARHRKKVEVEERTQSGQSAG